MILHKFLFIIFILLENYELSSILDNFKSKIFEKEENVYFLQNFENDQPSLNNTSILSSRKNLKNLILKDYFDQADNNLNFLNIKTHQDLINNKNIIKLIQKTLSKISQSASKNFNRMKYFNLISRKNKKEKKLFESRFNEHIDNNSSEMVIK